MQGMTVNWSKQIRQQAIFLQGDVARLLMRLPMGVQEQLARWSRSPHHSLHPHLQLLVAAQRLQGGQSLVDGDPVRSRRRFRLAMQQVRRQPTAVAAVRELSVTGHEGHPLAARLYRPDLPGTLPLMVFYHGGGFVVGDLDTHDEACRVLCQASGCAVLSVAYRLAPEAPAPMAAYDALAGLQWAFEHAAELQADPTRLVVAGDSAGGNLAAVVAQLARDLPCRPCAQLLIYPVVDVGEFYPSHQTYSDGLFLSQSDMDFATLHYVGQSDRHDPRISPLRGDLQNLPPALVVTAELDVLRDEGALYAQRLREAGNRVEQGRFCSLPHGFINMTPIHAPALDATVRMGHQLRQLLAELRTQPAA